MDPLLLQKQIRDNSDDLKKFLDELRSWEKDMKRKDQDLLDDSSAVPPVRSKVKRPNNANSTKSSEHKEVKGISSCDYSAWDKHSHCDSAFDVEKACEEVKDKEKNLEQICSEPEIVQTEEDPAVLSEQAVYEKELGNQHVKGQRWKEAIDCYTRAIQYNRYDAIFYANRALCYLKTKKPKLAETDCTIAIQLDKAYVKAYQRRALARVAIGFLDDARADFQKVLELEPNNSAAKSELSKLDKQEKSTIRRKEEKNEKREVDKNILIKKHSEGSRKVQSDSGDSLRKTVVPKQLVKDLNVLGAGGDVGNCDVVQSLLQEGDEKVVPVQKPPHLRSKKPLKLIPVEEVETFEDLLQQTFKTEIPLAHTSCKKIVEVDTAVSHVPNKAAVQDTLLLCKSQSDSSTRKHTQNYNSVSQSSVSILQANQASYSKTLELPPVPKTSVQFLVSWKLVKNNSEMRHLFLKQIHGKDFPQLFQESLESKEFSEIINSLDTDFIESNEHVYPYLLGLSEVKRFSALIMFLSKSDKRVVKKLLEHCERKGECSKEEHSNLLKRFEIN